MATQVTLPALGENVVSGDVLSLLVSEGDVVAKDQDLIEFETDKATLPIPSPMAGKVVKILVAAGETVRVGGAILELESLEASGPEKPAAQSAPSRGDAAPHEPGDGSSTTQPLANRPSAESPPPPVPPAREPTPESAPGARQDASTSPRRRSPGPDAAPPAHAATTSAATTSTATPAPPRTATTLASPSFAATDEDLPGDGRSSTAAGPAVRRLGRELGVDLRRVRPTSASGRITEDDVRNYVRKSQLEAEQANQGVTPPGKPDTDGSGAVRREKMSRMRQAIARNMVVSYTTIPQLTNFDDVDVTELERIRKDSKDDYAAQGIKLTAMPFLIKSVATALRRHPIVNASVGESGDEIVYKEYVNIGIAVDTERGLVVPVLRDADRKSIPQIARGLDELAQSARDGALSLDDMRGGTFTISNLGSIGGTYSTPIINPPEAAILLVGRSRIMPQYVDDAFEPREMMPLSITYDHRIVDGAAAARFLNDVKKYLANPGRLLLAP